MLLEGFHNALRTENGRSRRNRKPVSYTFGMCRSFFHIIHLHDWIPVMGCNELFGQMPSNFWSLAALWTYAFIVNSRFFSAVPATLLDNTLFLSTLQRIPLIK